MQRHKVFLYLIQLNHNKEGLMYQDRQKYGMFP